MNKVKRNKKLDELFAELCRLQLRIATLIHEKTNNGLIMDDFYFEVEPLDSKTNDLLEELGLYLYKNTPKSDEKEGS